MPIPNLEIATAAKRYVEEFATWCTDHGVSDDRRNNAIASLSGVEVKMTGNAFNLSEFEAKGLKTVTAKAGRMTLELAVTETLEELDAKYLIRGPVEAKRQVP